MKISEVKMLFSGPTISVICKLVYDSGSTIAEELELVNNDECYTGEVGHESLVLDHGIK